MNLSFYRSFWFVLLLPFKFEKRCEFVNTWHYYLGVYIFFVYFYMYGCICVCVCVCVCTYVHKLIIT